MAYRCQLEPPVVRTLTACPPAVRERVQGELGALVSRMPSLPVTASGREGVAVLACGFQVRYRMEPGTGLLRLTALRPLGLVRSPTS
ncbi:MULTISPECIES: hypothetical protein [Corallococcus]|uniref:Type II toxin-antitoxin system RelE/ParE family toxin n=2 Tax=Corallococcus TaxID=83461 RepID=A0A7Y4NDI9_9BACT|nr:hypothetical protein [Corallococcus exercitus]NOK10493.1 hypothetical protein [Corallococcus exercitus]GMU05204.1 hypothetical protein ASNO1_14560 [Corallococcus sp. NO1]